MAPPPETQKRQLARLCDLVAASLVPHLEADTSPPWQVTREDERRLLLALSRVNKAIRGWNLEEEVEEQQQRWRESDQHPHGTAGKWELTKQFHQRSASPRLTLDL